MHWSHTYEQQRLLWINCQCSQTHLRLFLHSSYHALQNILHVHVIVFLLSTHGLCLEELHRCFHLFNPSQLKVAFLLSFYLKHNFMFSSVLIRVSSFFRQELDFDRTNVPSSSKIQPGHIISKGKKNIEFLYWRNYRMVQCQFATKINPQSKSMNLRVFKPG